MVIHTVKPGETLYKISKTYGVSPTKIIENNGLKHPDRLSVGKKLLILTPTKSYTVRGGDTLERISNRFGVSERELKRHNPYLSERKLTYAEQVIAIKYDTPSYTSALFNGYYYKDTPKERLSLALAVADMITVSAYTVKDGMLKRFFNDSPVLEAISDAKKSAVMRVYAPERGEILSKNKDRLISDVIDSAKRGGYSGVALSAGNAILTEDGRRLIAEIRENLNRESLTVTLECDNAVPEIASVADRFVLQYEKCILDPIPTFDEGEGRIYREYAEKCDP